MRIKGAQVAAAEATAVASSTPVGPGPGAAYLERDPAFIREAIPFKTVSPISNESVFPVVVAAVKVRQVHRNRTPPKFKATSAAAGSQPKAAKPTTGKRKASSEGGANGTDALPRETINTKVAKIAAISEPLRLISPAGASHVPPTLVADVLDTAAGVAREIKRRQREAAKQRSQHASAVVSDGRVALRVLPDGQVPRSAGKTTGKAPKSGRPEMNGGRGMPYRVSRREASTGTEGLSDDGRERPLSAGVGSPDAAPIANWHPGMRAAYGINYIDAVDAPSGAMAPPVLTGEPARCGPMPLEQRDMPTFADDPVLASLQYLRYLAQSMGRLPQFPHRLQQGFNAEQRLYRERLARAMVARDGRRLEKPRQEGTRRSSRARSAPQVFIPMAPGGNDRAGNGRAGRSERSSDTEEVEMVVYDPAAATDVRLGTMYQAELPALLPRPSAPTSEEAARSGELILRKQAVKPPPREPTQAVLARDWDQERRQMAISLESARLAAAVGSAVASAFGLNSMGTVMAGELDASQQEGLYLGMKEHGRDFHAISKEQVPGVAPRRMAAYYYDVWKLRAVPAAVRWYEDKAREAEERAAEERVQEQLRAEEAARRAERQEASARRRQVKEAVQWIRLAAKGPSEVNWNKMIVRERATRLVALLREPRMIGTAAVAQKS